MFNSVVGVQVESRAKSQGHTGFSVELCIQPSVRFGKAPSYSSISASLFYYLLKLLINFKFDFLK